MVLKSSAQMFAHSAILGCRIRSQTKQIQVQQGVRGMQNLLNSNWQLNQERAHFTIGIVLFSKSCYASHGCCQSSDFRGINWQGWVTLAIEDMCVARSAPLLLLPMQCTQYAVLRDTSKWMYSIRTILQALSSFATPLDSKALGVLRTLWPKSTAKCTVYTETRVDPADTQFVRYKYVH